MNEVAVYLDAQPESDTEKCFLFRYYKSIDSVVSAHEALQLLVLSDESSNRKCRYK